MAYYQDIFSDEYMDLTQKFKVNPESCDNPHHYENYIQQTALLDSYQGMGTTHIFIDENDETHEKNIMGYITLRASSLIKEMGESSKFGHPALEIAELAVDKRYERQHVGTDMVKFAVSIAEELNNSLISVKYIVLCADPKAVAFYSGKALNFSSLRTMEDIPREHSNMQCVPMYLKIMSY